MTNKNYGNEPINPILDSEGNGCLRGLTKREYFAAMAMQGIVSSPAMIDTINWEWLSEESVKLADALITALNQSK